MNDKTITIDDVVALLGLEIRPGTRPDATSYNVKCPFCDDTKYKLARNVHN